MWQGSDCSAWLRLLSRNRFAVHLAYLHIAVIVTFVSFCNTVLRVLQDFWFGPRIHQTPISQAPIFIVGHWRTGTTLLHELLILDKRHNCPNTYQCLAPNHFLLTEALFTRLFWFLVPEKRPMDNMTMGWDRPQEDEFALCMLGQPSPYLTIAFPNHPPQDQDALDLRMSPIRRRRWMTAFCGFLSQLTYKDPRRLVLKSPTHSCRIPDLLAMFPEARFVHIVRDPYAVYPSTVNLWKSLYEKHGLQKPNFKGLEEHVLDTYVRLYERIEEGKKLIPNAQFVELRDEDLIEDPEREMERVYGQLGLDGFEDVRQPLRRYLAENAGYKTNRFRPLDPEVRAEITRRWKDVIERYGYGAHR